ncbi:Hypothetical predicted protein [Paramuricea clavata]|uniref:Uncharacterized protein n=1 Tax=Paramuricea clavata TaxID=317549 RepID=A0A7D9IC11_PARCT|nr:Hypothetical predicted protein [Paramuricea clavata]
MCTYNEAAKLKSPCVKPKRSDVKKSAKAIYEAISPTFKNTFGTSFAEALASVPESQLQTKKVLNKYNQEKHKLRREQYRKAKENIEEQMKDTAFLRLYGSGQSVKQWQRNRLALCFEPKAAATAQAEKSLEESKKPKDHVGNLEAMTWDKNQLRAEVEGYEDGHVVNWSNLAARYNVCNKSGQLAKNRGQIIKSWLISEGVDVTRFSTQRRKSNGIPISRRKKRRIVGGEISFPTEVHPKVLKQMLQEKLQIGTYSIGERIVPTKYEKLILSKDLEIKRVDFITEGRKIPLRRIREDLLQKHSQYLRKNNNNHYLEMSPTQVMERLKVLGELEENKGLDEMAMREKLATLEQTRNLMVWLDNSTVANHGYLVCLVTCLYDPAVFHTPEEYKEKTSKSVDIQKEIENPEVHIIARCSSADQEQLTYAETRVECIQELKNNCKIDDVEYNDKLRFSHGDSPARAHEAGQQKGGNYFCSTCGVHCDMTDDLAHVLNCKKAKPLGNLTKQELEQELASRQIFDDGNKADLQNLLSRKMRGKQRVPTLLFHNPQQKLSELGLTDYEILPCEPLDDVGHHIENIFTELPHHLNDKESKAMVESLELCLGSKDQKRTAYYRSAVVKTAGHLSQQNVLSEKPHAIINTLVEMQRILYAAEYLRCPSLILRYYNQSWLHSILLKELIQKPKKLTQRKLFGDNLNDVPPERIKEITDILRNEKFTALDILLIHPFTYTIR